MESQIPCNGNVPIDCAIIRAVAGDKQELMLAIAPRTGRHPVRLLQSSNSIRWMCQDGIVEILSIAKDSPGYSDLAGQIASEGLLVGEFSGPDRLAGRDDLHWILKSDPDHQSNPPASDAP